MGVEKQSHAVFIKKIEARRCTISINQPSNMPSILSFFERIFSSNQPLTIAEDAYIDDSVDEVLARPNPFAADLMINAQSHHHIIPIVDFLRHDHYLNPWLLRESHESILHDPRFSLNSIVILHQ